MTPRDPEAAVRQYSRLS